jgi:hypothetical protein
MRAPKPRKVRSKRWACRPAATCGHGTTRAGILAAAKSRRASKVNGRRTTGVAFGCAGDGSSADDAGSAEALSAFAAAGAAGGLGLRDGTGAGGFARLVSSVRAGFARAGRRVTDGRGLATLAAGGAGGGTTG